MKTVSLSIPIDELIIDNESKRLRKVCNSSSNVYYVGEDIYEENIKNYPNKCNRGDSEKFLLNNASFIEY